MYVPTEEEIKLICDLMIKLKEIGCMRDQHVMLMMAMTMEPSGFPNREECLKLIKSMKTIIESYTVYLDILYNKFPTLPKRQLFEMVKPDDKDVTFESYEIPLQNAFGFVFNRNSYKEMNDAYEESLKNDN